MISKKMISCIQKNIPHQTPSPLPRVLCARFSPEQNWRPALPMTDGMMMGSGCDYHRSYTVRGQGQARLAQGPTQPNPKRARVRPYFSWPGPARIGSRAKSDELAQPGPTLSESMTRV